MLTGVIPPLTLFPTHERPSIPLPGSRGTTILFHSLSQSQHVRFLCLRPTLILCVLRVSRTLAERATTGPGNRIAET